MYNKNHWWPSPPQSCATASHDVSFISTRMLPAIVPVIDQHAKQRPQLPAQHAVIKSRVAGQQSLRSCHTAPEACRA